MRIELAALLALVAGCAHGQATAPRPTVEEERKQEPAPARKPEPRLPPPGERARRLMGEALLAQQSEERVGAAQVAERFALAAAAEPTPGPARFDEAVALDRAGRIEEAEKSYLSVAHGEGELAFAAAERAAALAASRGDKDAARAAVELAARSLPAGDSRSTTLRAEVALLFGDAAAAQAAARQVLARAPKDVRALCVLARAHLKQGSAGTAKLLAARAAEADPEDAEPLLVKAEIARSAHDLPGELAAARAAVEADEGSAEAALLLGRVLYERGQSGEAVDLFAQAAELDKGSFAAQLALGRALSATGRSQEAGQALARAAALSPRSPEPHFELARLKLVGDGNAQAALEEAKVFLKLASPAPPPGHPIHVLVQRCEEALKKPAQASVVQQK